MCPKRCVYVPNPHPHHIHMWMSITHSYHRNPHAYMVCCWLAGLAFDPDTHKPRLVVANRAVRIYMHNYWANIYLDGELFGSWSDCARFWGLLFLFLVVIFCLWFCISVFGVNIWVVGGVWTYIDCVCVRLPKNRENIFAAEWKTERRW